MENNPLPNLAQKFPAPICWADCTLVTLEEAIMLSLGIDPEIWHNFEPSIDWIDEEEIEADSPHFGVHHQEYHSRKKVLTSRIRLARIRRGENPSDEIIVNLQSFVQMALRLSWSLPKWLSKGYRRREAPEGPNSTIAKRTAFLIDIAREVIPLHPEKNKSDLARSIARSFNIKHSEHGILSIGTVRNILFNNANAPFKNYCPIPIPSE